MSDLKPIPEGLTEEHFITARDQGDGIVRWRDQEFPVEEYLGPSGSRRRVPGRPSRESSQAGVPPEGEAGSGE